MFENKEELKKEILCQVLHENIDTSTHTEEQDDNTLKSANFLKDITTCCFDFAYKEGLNEHQIKYFVKFYIDLIKNTAMEELPIIEAAALVREQSNKLVATNLYKQPFLISSVGFISSTLLQHYHLILFALCYSRQQQIHMKDILIEVAPYEIDALKCGKQIDQWKLEEELERKEKSFVEEEKNLRMTMEESVEKMEKELKEYFDSVANLHAINIDVVADIIRNVISKHGEITNTEMEYALERSKALMTKNMEIITIQNDYKDCQKQQQQQLLHHQQQQTIQSKATTPTKRAPTASPKGKSKK